MAAVQEELIARVRDLAAADERIVGALMYGSFSQDQGDECSDVEFYLYFRSGVPPARERRRLLDEVAPTLLVYRNEYGVETVIFASFVRGEFHFEPAAAIAELRSWRTTWFASVESGVLYDETGGLTDAVRPLVAERPRLDEVEAARFLVAGLLNWTLMGANILARGDLARAHGFLGFIQTSTLQAARLLAGRTRSWEEPRRRLADELPEAFIRYRAVAGTADQPALRRAYAETWRWNRELIDALAARYGVEVHAAVADHLDRRLLDR